MACSYGDTLFIGSAPCKIHVLNYNGEGYDYVETYDFSTTYFESIYDMVLDPRDWY